MPLERGSDGPRSKGFKDPQIVVEGILRKALNSSVITFQLRVLRLIELTFLVTLPKEGSTRSPVYVRFRLDRAAEDPPGSIVIE
jgi:hypothetical protein